MISFANKLGNLTVVIGNVVYEIPTKSADQAKSFAMKMNDDRFFSDLVVVACKASPRIGNRIELENKDDPRMRMHQ